MENEQGVQNVEAYLAFTKDFCKMQCELINVYFDSENTFQKYKYASLSNVLAYVKPVLSKYNFIILQKVTERNEETYIETILRHTSGHQEITILPLFFKKLEVAEKKNIWHERGAAITYGRRYSISMILNISADEDTDAAIPFISKEEQSNLESLAQKINEKDKNEVLLRFKLKDLKNVPKVDYTALRLSFEKQARVGA